MANQRVLIVAFDALRPDMVTPELMPNLTRFAGEGVRFANNRSTYPTETRVNQTTLVTGTSPSVHGIVGNQFLDLVASPDKLFNTGDETELSAGDRRLGGLLVDTPVLSEILAENGLELAVVSAGTPGGCRILNHKAEEQNFFRFALKRPDASVPSDRITALINRIGPIPEHRIPSIEWLTYTTDVYLNYIEAEDTPAVTILWYCEPDNSYHHKGIGTPDNLAAIHAVDAEFGRILDWRAAQGLNESLQIITLSDHGQLTVSSEALDVTAKLQEAGFSVGGAVDGNDDAILSLSSAGGLYVRDSDPDLINQITAWLQAQPWCGPVFTREGRGSLSHDQVGIAHRRAPDIGFVVSSDDLVNGQGLVGTSLQDSVYPLGGGLHGGLHHKELHNWLALGGGAFFSGKVVERRSGIIDVLPTVLHLLDIEAPESVEGRILKEALANDLGDVPDTETETFTADGVDGYRAHLTVSRVGATRYLDRAWVTRS